MKGSVVAFSAVLLVSASAEAGGLYFSDRGVRPMGRAGAFVAGADDLGAVWYNPAGLTEAKTSFLADFTWVRFSNEYTRKLRIVDADGTVRQVQSPTIRGSSPILPLPTLVGSFAFGEEQRIVIAAGLISPYVALASYDKLVGGQPSPARYTLGSFDGSALAIPGVWGAYRPIDSLSIGLGVSALMGTFRSRLTFSASPQDRLIGAPEQTEYDAESQMSVGPIFAPTFNVGVKWAPLEEVRVGISYQHSTTVDSDAQIQVRLPTSAVFDGARVTGSNARVRFKLPSIFRIGVEFRPVTDLRVELAYAREQWSSHETIEATPTDIRIEGITGGPASVKLPQISIPRHFQDASSLRLGGEYFFPVAGYRFSARGGVSYEQSAVPPEYLSLSSLDFSKLTLATGGSLFIGAGWRFDIVLAHVFASTVNVAPADAKIGRINPLQKNAPFEAVNGGSYSAGADLIGVGLEYIVR